MKLFLTSVCTMAGRCVLNILTVWKMSTTPSYLILSRTMLSVMKTPVLPTPALSQNQRQHSWCDAPSHGYIYFQVDMCPLAFRMHHVSHSHIQENVVLESPNDYSRDNASREWENECGIIRIQSSKSNDLPIGIICLFGKIKETHDKINE